MKELKTNISEKYLPNWGVKEGIREFLQNCLDEHDRGANFTYRYDEDNQKLYLMNEGAYIDDSMFLLGATTKSDDSKQRGTWGEGFKVGILALIRHGKDVMIYNGIKNSRYESKIVFDENYGGKILCFYKESPYELSNGIVFEIGNITSEEWQSIQKDYLYFNLEAGKKKTCHGTLLTDSDMANRIYVGGIFVCENESFKYGYDFEPDQIKLNRDRNLPDWFYVRWQTSKIWCELAKDKDYAKIAFSLMESGSDDTEYFNDHTNKKASENIAEEFKEKAGENSYPVSREYERTQIESLDKKPYQTNENVSKTVRNVLGNPEDLKEEIKAYYVKKAMSNDDLDKLYGARDCLLDAFPTAKFYDEVVKTQYQNETIQSSLDNDILYLSHKLFESESLILREMIKHFAAYENMPQTDVWFMVFKCYSEKY